MESLAITILGFSFPDHVAFIALVVVAVMVGVVWFITTQRRP